MPWYAIKWQWWCQTYTHGCWYANYGWNTNHINNNRVPTKEAAERISNNWMHCPSGLRNSWTMFGFRYACGSTETSFLKEFIWIN